MPNRIVREGILRSRRIDALSVEAELFYRRLLSVVDDYGRHEADTVLLRSDLYPLRINRVSDEDVERWLGECTGGDDPLITLYVAKGRRYLQVSRFDQRLRAMKSRCPVPDDPLTDICQSNGSQPSADGHVRIETNQNQNRNETEGADVALADTQSPEIPGWSELVELASTAQMSLDPSPSSDLCQKRWRILSLEDRLAAVNGIKARIECGQYCDPAFVPTLQNYILNRRWRESLRPRAGPQLVDRKKAASEEAMRRILKERQDAERRKVYA